LQAIFLFADQTSFQQCLFVLNIGKTMAGIDTLLKTNHVANLFTIQNFAAKKLFLSESFQNWAAIESILSSVRKKTISFFFFL